MRKRPVSRRPNSEFSQGRESWARQPARPRLTQSRVAMALDTWNGSVCETVAVGTSPIRPVSGAILLAMSTASSLPRT